MKLRLEIVAHELEPGQKPCVGGNDPGPRGGVHAARWHFEIRMIRGSDVVVTRGHEREARQGYSCDHHLYLILERVHNEIQATDAARGALEMQVPS